VSITIDKCAEIIIRSVLGTCNDPFLEIEQLIEEGYIPSEFFYSNELPILYRVDTEMFTCDCCGWNYEISELSDTVDLTCINCYGDDQCTKKH
jgi:hypothetical protein